MNPVNKWIHDGGDLKGKNKRRLIVAAVCAVVGLVAAPFTAYVSLALLVVSVVKVKTVLTDKQ